MKNKNYKKLISTLLLGAVLSSSIISGCSTSEIKDTKKILDGLSKFNEELNKNNKKENNENKIENLDVSIQELVSQIEIEEPSEEYYDRDEYSAYQSYEYGGETYDSVRDYSYYASIYYNDKTEEYYDCYNGETTTGGPKGFDFEHIVPLHFVNQHGGDEWSNEAKVAYANNPSIGVSVNQRDNRVKSDKGPSEWLPSENIEDYCYTWLVILADYDLSCTQEDMDVLLDNVENVPAEELDYLPTYK